MTDQSHAAYPSPGNTIDKRTLGVYGKFCVKRTDGTDAPGLKHDGCEYFVLDITHDPFAAAALDAYSRACAAEYPALASDLRKLAKASSSSSGTTADEIEQRIAEIEAWTNGGHREVRDPDNFGGRCLEYLAWLTAELRSVRAALAALPTNNNTEV